MSPAPAVDDCSMLHRQITSELDKYLQEATEKHEQDDNYYDGQHVSTNTSNSQQETNFLEGDHDAGSDEEANNSIIPESHNKTPPHTTIALLNARTNSMMS